MKENKEKDLVKGRFVIIAKDIVTKETKVIQKYDVDEWIDADFEEKKQISFEEFCNIIDRWLEKIEEIEANEC